jgi:arylsulfatase
MAEPPDVLLLTVDALRADHLSCRGYRRETPTFDALAEGWLEFSTAASVSSHTREAMPPLLSGQYPERFVATGFTQLDASDTLAGRLRGKQNRMDCRLSGETSPTPFAIYVFTNSMWRR